MRIWNFGWHQRVTIVIYDKNYVNISYAKCLLIDTRGNQNSPYKSLQNLYLFVLLSSHPLSFLFSRYVPNPDFKPEVIRSISTACEGLCKWVLAMDVYDRVAKVSSEDIEYI